MSSSLSSQQLPGAPSSDVSDFGKLSSPTLHFSNRRSNPKKLEKMIAAIDAIRGRWDSVGGVFTSIVRNVPCSLIKLKQSWLKLLCHYPRQRALRLEMGWRYTYDWEHNDEFFMDEHGQIRTRTNCSGGIQKKEEGEG